MLFRSEIPAESARQSIAQSRAMLHNAHSSLSLHQPSFPCSAQIDNYQVALASGRQAWDRLALTASYRAASRVVLWALALFPSNPRGQTNPCSLPLETPTARPAHLSPWSYCLAIAVAAAHLACHRLDPHTAALPPPPPAADKATAEQSFREQVSSESHPDQPLAVIRLQLSATGSSFRNFARGCRHQPPVAVFPTPVPQLAIPMGSQMAIVPEHLKEPSPASVHAARGSPVQHPHLILPARDLPGPESMELQSHHAGLREWPATDLFLPRLPMNIRQSTSQRRCSPRREIGRAHV